jgi:outer membrane protein TolC
MLACATGLLAGCTVAPVALDRAERDELAAASRAQLFAGQEPITRPLTLYEATARAIKYQAEYRVRLMEEAAALGQLDVAQFDLLPKLTATAGYSTRSNDAFGFGFTPAGTVATNPSASVERTHTTASIGFTWNVLDFGVSYFRAKQLADQALIAEERRRKALQNLVQDVRLAWWRAEAAQRFLPLIDAFYEEIDPSDRFAPPGAARPAAADQPQAAGSRAGPDRAGSHGQCAPG